MKNKTPTKKEQAAVAAPQSEAKATIQTESRAEVLRIKAEIQAKLKYFVERLQKGGASPFEAEKEVALASALAEHHIWLCFYDKQKFLKDKAKTPREGGPGRGHKKIKTKLASKSSFKETAAAQRAANERHLLKPFKTEQQLKDKIRELREGHPIVTISILRNRPKPAQAAKAAPPKAPLSAEAPAEAPPPAESSEEPAYMSVIKHILYYEREMPGCIVSFFPLFQNKP